ncbi:hypothetical protein CH372_19950 [Leptospira meyeri]|nr:hypothetical protein CH372_19950 [Leptospira meyeri]
MITQLNFSEFYTSDHINERFKIAILEKLKRINFSIEEKQIADTKTHIQEKIRKLKNFKSYQVSKAGILEQKKGRENSILQEFFESIIAIFAIYLTFKYPLTTDKQNEIFFKQFQALLVGNREFNDDLLNEMVNKLYSEKTNKHFRKDFIHQIFLMITILFHNFSSAMEEFFLLDENTPQIKLEKYNNYLENNELFCTLHNIILNELSLTKLPINQQDIHLTNSIAEYKKYLPKYNYSSSYINLISSVFIDILANGSKIDKNDAIDYFQFQYIDNYEFFTMETSLRKKLEKINSYKFSITQKIISECSD